MSELKKAYEPQAVEKMSPGMPDHWRPKFSRPPDRRAAASERDMVVSTVQLPGVVCSSMRMDSHRGAETQRRFGKIMDSKIIFFGCFVALPRGACRGGWHHPLARHIFQPRIDRIFTNGDRHCRRFSKVGMARRAVRISRRSRLCIEQTAASPPEAWGSSCLRLVEPMDRRATIRPYPG